MGREEGRELDCRVLSFKAGSTGAALKSELLCGKGVG